MGKTEVEPGPNGSFDPESCTVYEEALQWVDDTDEDDLGVSSEDADEHGHYVSAATGTDYSHERLYHTADDRWVLMMWTDQSSVATYAFISDSGAAAWRDNNGHAKPAPRRGRPEVGEPVHLRLPAELRARVDQFASASGVTRAEAVRRLLTGGLASLTGKGDE